MENLSKAKAAVDVIVSRLETRFRSFNISEIWKAGSLGHGTVVPGHYDIDLVLYSRDIDAKDVRKYNSFGHWLAQLKMFIDGEFKLTSTIPSRSVKFNCSYEGVTLAVDLLVSPYWDNPIVLYQFLRGIPRETRGLFTVSASKWQVQFFQGVENQVKEYIRQAKDWRNRSFNDSDIGRPSSYLLSLLVLKAYEIANSRYNGPGPREVTTELIKLVKTPGLDIYWEKYYRLAEYSDLLPLPPRVIDPANPANNVWKGGIKGGYLGPTVLIQKIVKINLFKVAGVYMDVYKPAVKIVGSSN